MKVRVLGYSLETYGLPKAVDKLGLYHYMQEHAGGGLGKRYRFGAELISVGTGKMHKEWWAGMILRIRDSQAYTKLTEIEGKSVLTAENLGENEKLAEMSFFLAHPETGHGLFTQHYQATSFFGYRDICARLFNKKRRNILKDSLVAAANSSPEDREAIRKDHAGFLSLGQLSLDAELKDLVKTLVKVNSVDFKFKSVVTKETLFRGISERAISERVKFIFPPDADVAALADELDAASENDDLEELKVLGKDDHGDVQEFSLTKNNPLVFDEYEYDDMMKGMSLDLSNWSTSIAKSNVVSYLTKLAHGAKVYQLLSTP